MAQRTTLQTLARWGAWLVMLAGLALALVYAMGWSDVIAQSLSPHDADLGSAIDAGALTGLALYGILGATLPFLAALWGLWHAHRALKDYAEGRTDRAAHDIMILGLAIMVAVASTVLAGLIISMTLGQGPVMPVTPLHAGLFIAGMAIVVLSRWRRRSAQ